MPVHRETIVGDLLLGHDLAQQAPQSLLGAELLLLGLQPPLQLGQLPVAELGGPVEVVGPLGLLRLPLDPLDLLPQRLHPLERLALGLPLGPHGVRFGPQVGQLLAQLLQALLAGCVLLLGQGRLLDLEAHHPAGQLVELGRHGVDLGAEHGAGLVHQVDGLVGEEAVGDVAVAQHHRGHQGAVLDAHAVEHLEPLAQAPEDGDGVLLGRLVDEHGLEAPFEGGVLLDVLAVLVEGGGADQVQLAAGEHGLEHVAGVHRPLGRARAHHRVDLVDEQQDPALGHLDLVEDRLQPLLELAPVLGPGHEGAHVEGEDRLVLQALGHVAPQDALGQALDDGRLADAGVADEHRVVLGLAGEDLHDPPDLGVAPDHGVEPSGAGVGHQVAPVLLQRFVGHLGHGRRDPLVPPDRGQGLEERVTGEPLRLEHAARGRLGSLVEEGDHQVLHRDVLVLEALGLATRPLSRSRDSRWVTITWPGCTPGPLTLGRRDSSASTSAFRRVGVGARLRQQPGHQPLGLVEEGQEQVLAVHFGVAESQRLGLGVVQGLLGLLGEAVQVHRRSVPPEAAGRGR